MTKIEALKALCQAKKITHMYFIPEEWVKVTGLMYEFEDGSFCSQDDFWYHRRGESWDNGWDIWNN